MFENIQNKYIIALIDPEYFYSTFLTEDTHPRSRLTNKLYKKENAKNLKTIQLSHNATGKDMKEALFKVGNNNQNRKWIRNQKVLDKDDTFKIRKARNAIISNNPNTDIKKLDNEIMQKRNKAANIKNNTPLRYTTSSSYVPSHTAIIKTSNDNPRADEHEKRHYKDDMYIRNKYGRSVSNRLFKMNAKDNAAGQDGMNDLSRAKTPNEKIEAAKKLNRYLSNPLEHNGLKTGASMKNKHDTDVNNRMDNYSKNVLDKYIQKHKRPEGSFDDFKKNHQSF